ncbi:uncharacterized protein BJX67DRAFT_188995 [Aspergillus lucknowensis]|uniref:F-box domain-containing protein n=1 Tax=Aspergillus lucknowensis TaxID=176173 RepID=A0ABR4LP31_9EURO
MLIRALGHLARDGKIVKGCVCHIKHCMPWSVRSKIVLVITDVEVVESFGVLEKIGEPSPVDAVATSSNVNSQKEYILPCWLPISRFPREIFDTIVSNLNQKDKLALSLVSKELRSLVGAYLYSVVELSSKEALAKFASALTRTPEIGGLVRTFLLTGDVCCIDPGTCSFIVEQLSLLRDFRFEPFHEAIDDHCVSLRPIIQKLISGHAIKSLKSLTIRLDSSHALALQDTREQLLQTIFLTPSIKHLQLFYGPCHSPMGFDASDPQSLTLPRLKNARTKFTNLRTLTLQWDDLPLSSVHDLLQLPRNLEFLTLGLSLRSDDKMTLDTAVEPIANSVRELELQPMSGADSYLEDSGFEDSGLRWSTKGLTSFTALQHLRIPSCFLTETHGFDGRTPWLPPSLVSICLTDSTLEDCRIPEPAFSTAHPIPRRQRFVTLDGETTSLLRCFSQKETIQSLPNLRLLILPRNHRIRTSYPRLTRWPPMILVGKSLRPLVDQGFHISMDVEDHANILLDVKIAPGF